MTTLIETRDLSRYYGRVVGLNDLTLDIDEGVTGLVGANGAGKSTFLKLVAGEIRPSRGAIRVLGFEPFANREYFRRVGFAPQQDAVYGEMTGLEFVTFLVRLSGFSRADADARARRAIDRVQLGPAMDRRTQGYSKGMRQRIRLAQAIAHEPRFLIVDEPMSGLDPLARRDMQVLFRELSREGVSILISSHILHEVEDLTPNIVLLHRGRLLAQGAVTDIRRQLARYPRRVELAVRDPRALGRELIELACVISLSFGDDGGTLVLETNDLEAVLQALPEIVTRTRAGLRSLESPDASLEAVFDYMVS